METRSKSMRGARGLDVGDRDTVGESQTVPSHDNLSLLHLSPVEVLETPVDSETELGDVNAERSQENTYTARPGTFTLETRITDLHFCR